MWVVKKAEKVRRRFRDHSSLLVPVISNSPSLAQQHGGPPTTPDHQLDLTMFVPGSACGAPNVTMAAPGRTCSRQTTEVNFPDIVENSYTQQEETKPNFRDSKNRLLLSQVAYFQNYQLKTDKYQKDHDEEQKYRDRKNKLLMSQVAYYLACRLKTKVPGLLYCAPKVIMVASGRPPSRKKPESIEKSCSQQEENKPNVGGIKNRLLLSQVAYFQNYRMKSYNDRKDHEEEQKYGDSKNKLFMSQVAYYLACQLKMKVPGFLCSARNVIVVASGRPFSGKIPEVNVPEGIEKFCSQQEDKKPDVRVSRNRCLLSEVNYSLNYRLKTYEDRKDHEEEQKYRDSENKLVMSQVVYYLACQLTTEVPGFLCSARNVIMVASGRPFSRKIPEVNVPEGIEKFCSQQEDKKPDVGVSRNRCLLSEVNYSLNYRLKTYDDSKDHNEDQKYRDSKIKHLMSQTAYYLDCRLKTEENAKDEDEDVHVTEAEKIQESPAPREVQKLEVKEVPEDSVEECVITHSNSYGPTDSSQPHGDTSEITFEEESVDSALGVESESSHDVAEDAVIILSENRKHHNEEQKHRNSKNKFLMCQLAYYRGCRLEMEVPGFRCAAPNVNMVASGRPPARKIPEVNVPEGIEKSCSQQEENQLNVGAIKNRLPLSLVAYFLNYRLQSYDRKDQDEEQKYRDCKNKLLMCQVAYYLGCRLKTEVPGFRCAAPNVNMVASGRPPARKIPEVNVPEDIEKSCSQQEENQPNVRAIKNRLPLSLVAYFLNYRLKSYEDRKDQDEEQKYRDCKNKLLLCQVAYYLSCRLKTEVPGFRCAAPSVNMVASGRPPARKIPEVSIPEGIEKSCSQQEENQPNVGAIKNRLPLSLVAYFLNYQLKSYKDRKDQDEEQKYRDCKNKLLLCQVAYYLGCRLKTEVPGFWCAAPNVNMVASGRPPARKIPEVNVPEGIEKSCSQQEENQLNVGAIKNRLPLSLAAYFLKYRLKSYEDRKDQDEEQKYRDCKNKHLMCQVAYYLGCRLKTEVPGFRCAAPNVNMVASGRPPARKIPEVNVPESIEKSCSQQEENQPNVRTIKNRLLLSLVAYFLMYRLKSYNYQKDHDEEQKYRDSKNKHLLSQVAYFLGCQLKTEENDKDKDDVHVAEAEKIQESPAPREVQKVEVKKVPEDSLEECVITHSNSYGPTDPSQPHRDSSEITFEEDSIASALAEESESSHDVAEDALIILSESQGDDEEEEEKGPVPPRNLQESVEEEAPQESWDEGDSTLLVPSGTSAFNETFRSNLPSLEEQQVNLAVDIDKIKNDQEEEEDQGPPCPRLSMELVEAEEPEVFRYSLDLLYSTYTAYPEFYYTCQAYTYAIFLFVEERVRLTLDMDSRFLTMTVIRLHLVSRAEKVPCVSHHDCGTRTIPPFVYHHDCGTRTVPPYVSYHDRGTRTVPPFVYHQDRDARTIPPFVYHYNRDARTVPPFVYHHDRGTRTVPPFVYHHDRGTRTVPPFVYHHDRGTRTVPPFVYHRDRDTRTVPPFVYHHDHDTRTVPAFFYHHDCDARSVPFRDTLFIPK
ncbi:hypothetical protein P7K49_037309 [Saguinus oedipus]|uniref:Olduvai domain-containing protein n=1 Tax=Saguinus oedipus TaxID=9490 RepID=A0ABQ9THX2_SAGOE|nr:hypothetical protein P7K49_037309 [Saguinus oedipus]